MLEGLCMQTFKRIKPISYLLLFIALNMVLSFLLEPASGTSGKMWREYYMEEELDTIFIGRCFGWSCITFTYIIRCGLERGLNG